MDELIIFKPSQVRELANQYRSEAKRLCSVINKMDMLLKKLQTEWKDEKSESYVKRYQEIKPVFIKGKKLIQEIADSLESGASFIEETDASIIALFKD